MFAVKGYSHNFPTKTGGLHGRKVGTLILRCSGENLVTPLISLFGNTLYVMLIALWQWQWQWWWKSQYHLSWSNREGRAITPQRESWENGSVGRRSRSDKVAGGQRDNGNRLLANNCNNGNNANVWTWTRCNQLIIINMEHIAHPDQQLAKAEVTSEFCSFIMVIGRCVNIHIVTPQHFECSSFNLIWTGFFSLWWLGGGGMPPTH